MAVQKPAGHYWTYEDLFELPEDRRYEIINGELYELPAPNVNHALIIMNLVVAIAPLVWAVGGKIMSAPVDVFIPGGNPVEPDVMVVFPENLETLRKRGIEGAPNLVIEVLSPSNSGHDRIRKRDLYARAGIPEYWIVDPEARSVEVLQLELDGYHTLCRVSGDIRIASALVPTLSLNAGQVFEGLIEETP